MDDPREYPICAACKKQIDLQEGPVCLDCRGEGDSMEFDAITVYRNLVDEQVGRPVTDEEWESLTEKIGRELEESDWTIVDNAIDALKE